MVYLSHTRRVALRGLMTSVLVCASVLIGCGEKPVIATAGTPAVAGGMQFALGDYDVRVLEISEGDDTYEYPKPVLAIPITVTNSGEGSFIYSPTHSQQQMSEAQTPLLYLDPGAEAELPPESKSQVNGVYLEKGLAKGQTEAATTLNKGDSVSDVFLFEVPDSAQDLILSVPPSMHRGKMPLLFRFNFQPMEAKGPKLYAVGTAADFQGVKFSVDSAALEYVKIDDTAQGEGFSTDPLLKISYTIENGAKEVVAYEPSHNALGGVRGAAAYTSDSSLKRVKFAATTRIDGQVSKTTNVEPGKSVTDFVLFEAPAEGTSSVSFEFPAASFSRSGLARYTVDFENKKPAKPKGLD